MQRSAHEPGERPHWASATALASEAATGVAAGAAPGETHELRTRGRVLSMVTELGPITAAELGERLGLTAAAVRRHLDALAEDGTIRPHEPVRGLSEVRGRGRPARSWVVAEGGHDALPSRYDELALQAMHYLAEHGGPGAVAGFARQRVAGLERRYAAILADLPARASTADRAEALVAALQSDGFAASVRTVGVAQADQPERPALGLQLCQGHCPVARVAEEHPALCEAETDAFSRLLGVHVQRLATLAQGGHVCTTYIPLTQKKEGTV